jgi:hypothetical protein
MNYQLRWGPNTWIPALFISAALGILILVISSQVMGEQWHSSYFVPVLGYYVLISICQSHYFKSRSEPNWEGFSRQAISIVGAIILFWMNGWIMGTLMGIPEKLVLPGQLTLIVLGFFFFGWDDFMFLGALSRWLKLDGLKAVFWYLFTWLIWYIVYAMPNGPVAALGHFSKLNLEYLLALSQWIIIMSLMIAITWKDYLATIRFSNDYSRGILLCGFAIIAGVSIAYICFGLLNLIGIIRPGIAIVTHEGNADVPAMWHHVLYIATYPLIPLVLFGLYTNHFNNMANAKVRALARTGFLCILTLIGYFTFRFVIAPSGLLGYHPWWHHLDLVFNFTIAIIALSHHWFNGRLGFLVEKSEAMERASPRAADFGPLPRMLNR